MKKIILLILVSVLSIHFASASCSTTFHKMKAYPKYKVKIDNLFKKISNADKTTQKKMYIKLDNVTKKYLKILDKVTQKKYYSIIENIQCKNNYSFSNAFSEEVSLIYEYYSNLSIYTTYTVNKEYKQEHNIEAAYNLKYKPSMSLSSFYNTYKSVKDVAYYVRNIKYIGNNSFIFSVDVFAKGKTPERYRTIMKVIEGKLQTLSVKKIEKEILESVTNGNVYIYLEWNKGDKHIYIKNGGEKKLIFSEKFDRNSQSIEGPGLGLSIYDLEFIDTDILMFHTFVWEVGKTHFYSIKNNKVLSGWSSLFGITDNNKYLYTCGEAGIIGGSVGIYKKSDFSPIFKEDSDEIRECIGYKNNILYYETGEYRNGKNIEDKRYFDFNSMENRINGKITGLDETAKKQKIMMIEKYYGFLEEGKLELAFNMKDESKYSKIRDEDKNYEKYAKIRNTELNKFKNIYNFGQKVKINVNNFEVNGNKINYTVVIIYSDGKKEVYKIKAKIVTGKWRKLIKTLSVE